MMAESTDIQKGQLVVDHPSVETGQGSVNAEQYEVQIRDGINSPAGQQRQEGVRPRVFTAEHLAEIKRKSDKMETGKYFALKVSEVKILLHLYVTIRVCSELEQC
jgi:hypothetical protein